MHTHVYYKLQVKISFLAIWVGTFACSMLSYILSAENKRLKVCQFYASNRELTPIFHFHLPDASNAKSATCMAAFLESLNWVFFPHISSGFFFPKTKKSPHFFVSERQNQKLFLSQNFTSHSTWHSRTGTLLSSTAIVLIHFTQSLNRNYFHVQVCLF